MKSTPKKIVISHVYSRDNKGDAVLTSVLIKDLKRKYPNATIDILALQPDKNHQDFEGVPEHGSFMGYVLNNSYHPLRKLMRALYMIPMTLLWAIWFSKTHKELWLPHELRYIAKMYTNADLIVPVGGGHIRSHRGGLASWFNVPLLLHPLIFGYILGKPTVLYSQSIGPFRGTFEEKLVAFTLKRMDLILLREDTSMKLLQNLGVKNNIMRAIDSGFLHASSTAVDIRKRFGISKTSLIIGVTVRAWLKGDDQVAYEKAVAAALDEVVKESNVHIVFIPQVTAKKGDDDRMVSRRVFKYMKYKNAAVVIDDEPDHHEIKALYDGLDVLVGTRFHSVIFSLTSYVPVVAIEYEHKTSGIMHDLGLERWVLKIEEVTKDNLVTALRKLLKERGEYEKELKVRLPGYIEEARQAVEHLHKAYESAV